MSNNKYIIDEDSLTGIADAIRGSQKKQFAYNHAWTVPSASAVQVIYENVLKTVSGGSASGSINVASLFPGLSFSYLFIRDNQTMYGSYLTLKDEDGNFITDTNVGLARCAVVPFSTNQYIPYYVGSSSFPVNIDIFPLDQKMNHIVYDEEEHAGLSHTKIDSRMTMPQQSSLIRLQDFGLNITNKKNGVYFFNDTYYNPIDMVDISSSMVPKMDLRYYGVNKLEDIKMLFLYTQNYYRIAIIPSLSLSRMDSLISGHQDLGYGYRPFLLNPVSNKRPPFFSTDTSTGIFYKNGRLYSNYLWTIDTSSVVLLVV